MGCPTPSLHLHSSIGKQGEATSGRHPNATSLVLSFLFLPFTELME